MLCILNFSKSVVKLSELNVPDCISADFLKAYTLKRSKNGLLLQLR